MERQVIRPVLLIVDGPPAHRERVIKARPAPPAYLQRTPTHPARLPAPRQWPTHIVRRFFQEEHVRYAAA